MNQTVFLDPPPGPKALTAPPARGRVLVVAPHPDDELIGPGATVLLHKKLGDPIRIAVLTDGTTGDAESTYDALTYRSLREEESRAAASRLGAAKIQFFRFQDGARAREEDLGVIVPRLLQEFEEFKPEVIYAPHLGEIHADHFVAAVAVRRAVQQWSGNPRCFGYEIWSPLVAEYVVDVTEQMAEKQEICRLYETQLKHHDLIHYFTGMNGYRALFLGGKARYGEAFLESDRGDPS